MIFSLDNKPKGLEVLQEAYYGKPKEFILIEKELEKLIKKINGNTDFKEITKMNKEFKTNKNIGQIALSDEVNTIERLFTQFFGTTGTMVNFYSNAPTVVGYPFALPFNAYTVTSALDVPFNRQGKNIRLKSNGRFMVVNVDMSLIRLAKLSAEETMAIILHEFGHNMYGSFLPLILQAITCPLAILLAPLIKLAVGVGNKALGGLTEAIPTVEHAFAFASDIIAQAYGLLGLISLPDPRILMNLITNPGHILIGYSAEKYSDSFATSYGYGPALSSALSKLENPEGFIVEKNIRKIPGINLAVDFMNVQRTLLVGLVDPHPRTPVRIISQLKKLKRDLNDPNTDPRLKEVIRRDIAKMEKFIDDDYLNPDNEINKQRIVSHLYNKIIIKTFDGKVDAREFLSKLEQNEE